MNTIKKFLLITAAFFSVSAWATVEVTGFEVSEADGTGTWNVTVNPGYDITAGAEGGIDYHLYYTTVDDTAEDESGDNDYKKQEGFLDFSEELTQQIVVPIVQDQKVEGTEQLHVELYEVTEKVLGSTDQIAGPLAPPVATGTGTIIDDDIELLVKVAFQGVGGGPVDLELDCQGNGTIDDSTKTTVGGEATFLVANFIEPLDCTAAPVGPPPGGSTLISTDCDPGMDEEDTECLIVFGATRATFRVTKFFADGNNVDEVTVSIDCNTGLILDQDKLLSDNEWVEFVVTDYTDGTLNCTITEDGETGYSGEYYNVTLDITNDESCEYLEISGADAAFECEITNSPDPVAIVVNKVWVIEGSATAIDWEYEIDLYCQASGMTGSGAYNVGGNNWRGYNYSEGDDTFVWSIIPLFPTSTCYAEEYSLDSYVEVSNGCSNLVVSAGNGAECTITNTVFFEGIPTLSQYGMALLALLMLSVGFVGFRRYA